MRETETEETVIEEELRKRDPINESSIVLTPRPGVEPPTGGLQQGEVPPPPLPSREGLNGKFGDLWGNRM